MKNYYIVRLFFDGGDCGGIGGWKKTIRQVKEMTKDVRSWVVVKDGVLYALIHATMMDSSRLMCNLPKGVHGRKIYIPSDSIQNMVYYEDGL